MKASYFTPEHLIDVKMYNSFTEEELCRFEMKENTNVD